MALIHARNTGYLATHDLTFHGLHLVPFTCASTKDFKQFKQSRGLDYNGTREARVAVVWDAQLAAEETRIQAWIANVAALLTTHTPFPKVLVTLTALYL